jgi:hypothetical protein
MFNNTRKVLDEFEEVYKHACLDVCELTKDEEDILTYFNMHLAKALMQDKDVGAESVAKIILAAKNLSSEITVKVE